MLALAEVEQGHDGGLFVLGRVALEDLGDELLILGVELEGQVGVVVGCVSVLEGSNSRSANFVSQWAIQLSLSLPEWGDAAQLQQRNESRARGGSF